MQRKSKDTKPKDRKGGSSAGKHTKKAKSGSSTQKKQTTAAAPPKKAWCKDGGKSNNRKGDDDDPARAARGALRPVKVKLDKEGRDTILDILHQLHVAQDDADGDESDSEDDDNGDESEEEDSETDFDEKLEDDGEDCHGDDNVEKQGHGDFEYDGSFGELANHLSDLMINDSPVDGNKNGDAADGQSKVSTKSKSPTTDRKPSSGSAKCALRSNVTREKLLATMVQEDRKIAREERGAPEGLSSAVIAAAAVGATCVKGNYRRPDPPSGGGKGNDKVRLEVCAENKKTGAPDLNGKKMMVFDRKEPIERFIQTSKAKLHMKKKAKGAAVLEGEEVVDWLTDLSWVPNGAVVFISADAAGRSCKKPKTSSEVPAASTTSGGKADTAVSTRKANNTIGTVGAASGHGAGKSEDNEDEDEALALAALSRIRESYKRRARGRDTEVRGSGAEGGAREDEEGRRMLEKSREVAQTDRFRQMMSQRKNLPAYSQREDIVDTIRDNQVVVLSGETGCGKTTQVPQFVLDSIIRQGQGGKCNIVCTQPRRISAVGVAERVAAERCEAVGGSVGYQIRLESRMGPSTRLTFCTTGILLRRLTSDEMLGGVSHIMVDEVHERDLQTDFLLVILRDLLPKRPDLRVVLMSATLQADLFTKYFHNCPAISIPGRTFPVEIHYMDHLNRVVRGSKTPALMPRVSGPGLAGIVAAGRGRGGASAPRQTSDRSRGGSSAGGRGSTPLSRGRGGRHPSGGGRGAEGRGAGDDDDDAFSMMYDPLTGEPVDPLDANSNDGKASNSAAAAMVSPKCEDKVDYDFMVDLVDHIMTTEARETARKEVSAAGGAGGGVGSAGSRGTGSSSSSSSNSSSGGGGGHGGGYNNRRGQQDGSWRGGSSACRGAGAAGAGGRGSTSGEPLGAILIFLPGFAEIDQLVRALERHPRIGRGASRIFPLHSSLPSHQQKSIFQRMPPGVRKIVVSTNIAETSVTIDDCTHVIDAGRVREMRYDPITRMSCLVEVWISKASGSQRAGRAGRVRAGQCWRLYPEPFYDSYMPPHTLAEMLRTPLEELVLQVLPPSRTEKASRVGLGAAGRPANAAGVGRLRLGRVFPGWWPESEAISPSASDVQEVLLLELGSPAEFLDRAIEPPPPKMLRAALRNLYDLQAILILKNSLRPILTPLGYHLAHLPMDARVGKLLLVGAILQCLDPILTIAAALSYKAPFQRPFGEQARADAARQRFAQHKSDHLAIVEAFGAWRNKRRIGSYDDVRRWCRENFLSHPTLEMLDSLREQFRQQLVEVGFTTVAVASRRAGGRDTAAAATGTGAGMGGGQGGRKVGGSNFSWDQNGGAPGERDPDRNAGNIALVQSALCAGLYPNVAAFMRPDPQRQLKKAHFITRDDLEPVFMHPSSVNHGRFASAAGSGRQVWVMYHSKMKTKQVYLHDATYATPFSLMLWGARIRHDRSLERTKKEGIEVVIDNWLRFRMDEKTAVAFKAMRRELNNLLVGKIEDPFADTGPLSGMLVVCLGRLLDIEARCQ